MGRASVDLYGEQVGGRLEDMRSFNKYLGGSPTNTAAGAARLGLNAGLLTRVGNDHMGRFIREQLIREGVDCTGVLTDEERLTALVILGIRDSDTFPLIFYRENCADMALCEADVDPALIARAGALLVNGTHLSGGSVFAASWKAAQQIKAQGGRVVFDIDYRPVLWGLTSKDNGEDRFVGDAQVTSQLRRILPLCDLIVGTEEEVHILGGTTDTLAALRSIRADSDALIVLKRGADGCIAYEGAIPADLEQGIVGHGFPIEVFNVLGAGDAFMAGFLRGWLRGEPIDRCCTWGNACGAIVVSRHGCAPAQPTWDELQLFLSRQDWPRRLRASAALEQLHWSSRREAGPDTVMALAIDHRAQLEQLAEEVGCTDAERISEFKTLALDAMRTVAGNSAGFGMLLDGRYGVQALEAMGDLPHWVARPIEFPGSIPLEFEGGPDVGVTLSQWPTRQVVKCLAFYHPDDPAELRAIQDKQLLRLADACRATGHEFLLEIIASKSGPITQDTMPRIIEHIYDLGIYPDWWKLESLADAASWTAVDEVIRRRDPHCRGILLLGLSAPIDDLIASFAVAATCPSIRGFAVGRSIFWEPARQWLGGAIDDAKAVRQLAQNFARLVEGWRAVIDQREAA